MIYSRALGLPDPNNYDQKSYICQLRTQFRKLDSPTMRLRKEITFPSICWVTLSILLPHILQSFIYFFQRNIGCDYHVITFASDKFVEMTYIGQRGMRDKTLGGKSESAKVVIPAIHLFLRGLLFINRNNAFKIRYFNPFLKSVVCEDLESTKQT